MKENEIRAEWFKDHHSGYSVMKDEQGNEMERLRWGRPNSTNYAVWYVRMGSVLFVTGDLGSAVYRWGESVTLEWISRCDIGYFAEKCEASEEGREFKVWDPREAIKKLRDIAKDYVDREKTCDFMSEVDSAVCTEGDWHAWLHDRGHEFLGDDYSEFGDVGRVLSCRCISHLTGLKMAFEQIKRPIINEKQSVS